MYTFECTLEPDRGRMRATAKDLRIHGKRLLEAVERGEEVVITYRGKARARLVPAERAGSVARRDTGLFGLWRDHMADREVTEVVDELRRSRF
jgi:prevent-host-death family protein